MNTAEITWMHYYLDTELYDRTLPGVLEDDEWIVDPYHAFLATHNAHILRPIRPTWYPADEWERGRDRMSRYAHRHLLLLLSIGA